MVKGEMRDRILDGVHRRALALAKMTAPGHACRAIDNVLAMPAGNLMRTLCVALGRPFLDEMLDSILACNDEHYGLCRFCRKERYVEGKGMCQTCWDDIARQDRELDEQELMDAPNTGQPP